MNILAVVRHFFSIRTFTVVIMITLVSGFFPISYTVANAARTGVLMSDQAGVVTDPGTPLPLKLMVADDGSGKPQAVVVLEDGSANGWFTNGNLSGGCTSNLVGDPVSLQINSNVVNKAFCYANAAPGVYTITATLYVDAVQVGESSSLNVTVEDLGSVWPTMWNNTCLQPETYGLVESSLGSSAEVTLQAIFNENGFGSVNVEREMQMMAQAWRFADPDPDSVTIKVTVLGSYASNKQAFGYYTAGDKDSFVPLFKQAGHTAVVPTLAIGDSMVFELPNNDTGMLGFGLDTIGNPSNLWLSQSYLNIDDQDNLLMYNPEENVYLLAFEDRPEMFPSDKDYNDLVVKIEVLGCDTFRCMDPGAQNYDQNATKPGDETMCIYSNTQLSLFKIVKGGIAVATDWLLSATGPTTISGYGSVTSTPNFAAGTYTLSESGGPNLSEGWYEAGPWECVGDVTNDRNQIVLQPGQSARCSITNTYIPPDKATLMVVKKLVQDNGGVDLLSDFSFSVSGDLSTTSSWTNGKRIGDITYATTTYVVDPGTYTVIEDILTKNKDRYEVSYSGDCNPVVLAKNETAVCTIVNDDIAPVLTVINHVINDDHTIDPEKSANDFTMVVSGSDVSQPFFPGSESGTTIFLDAGNYSVGVENTFGYNKSPDCVGVLDLGQLVTCTITNDDPDPTVALVTFVKEVINNYGGTAVSDDFGFMVSGNATATAVAHGGSLQLPIGVYGVSENTFAGYEFVRSSDFCLGGKFEISQTNLGKYYKCVFLNRDIEPWLTVTTVLEGGKATISDFDTVVENTDPLVVDSRHVSSSQPYGYTAGTYQVHQSYDSTLGRYTTVYSGDCDSTGKVALAVGDTAECVITNSAYTVTGYKWHDENENGIYDPLTEKRLADWEIVATDGVDMIHTYTDATGYYELALWPGEWTIGEVQQAGWEQTFPEKGACNFTFDDGTTDFDRVCNFGNHLIRRPILSCDFFEAIPNSNVQSGSAVTLTWQTTDADWVSINNSVGDDLKKDGTTVVQPIGDTIYTLTARRALDQAITPLAFVQSLLLGHPYEYEEVSCQVLVDVSNGGGGGGGNMPHCDLFEVTHEAGSVSLNWETRNGTRVYITEDGEEFFASDDATKVAAGMYTHMSEGRSYELTVTRGSRSDTCTAELLPGSYVSGRVLGEQVSVVPMPGPQPLVLGEQVSVVPLGAADAGAGGASPVNVSFAQVVTAILSRGRSQVVKRSGSV